MDGKMFSKKIAHHFVSLQSRSRHPWLWWTKVYRVLQNAAENICTLLLYLQSWQPSCFHATKWDNGNSHTALLKMHKRLCVEVSTICPWQMPCWKCVTEFCCSNGWSLHKQDSLGISAHGPVCVLLPHFLQSSTVICISNCNPVLGVISRSADQHTEEYEGSGVVWWWPLWFHGPLRQIWRLHNVLFNNNESRTFWTNSGKKEYTSCLPLALPTCTMYKNFMQKMRLWSNLFVRIPNDEFCCWGFRKESFDCSV